MPKPEPSVDFTVPYTVFARELELASLRLQHLVECLDNINTADWRSVEQRISEANEARERFALAIAAYRPKV